MNNQLSKKLYFTILCFLVINNTIAVNFLSDYNVSENLDEIKLQSMTSNKEKATKDKDYAKCVTPTGKSVDWYFIFLMNREYNKFVYMDNTMKDSKIFDLTIEDFPPLKLALSLNSKDNNYIVWNDEPIISPEKPFSKIAHSKGILAYNSDSGVYLVHSLPKFPSMSSTKKDEIFLNELPNNQGSYSQTFLCVSFDYKNLYEVIDTLKDIKIGVQSNYYGNSFDKDLDETVKNFDNGNKSKTKQTEITVQTVTSIGGSNMNFFAKPKSVLELPWDGHIPGFYKEDFYVGTWTRPELLAPNCKKYKTFNILKYSVKEMTYNNTQDHSKWGHSEKVFCVGDLNRTSSQLNRSGTVMCLKSALVSGIVGKFAEETDSC